MARLLFSSGVTCPCVIPKMAPAKAFRQGYSEKTDQKPNNWFVENLVCSVNFVWTLSDQAIHNEALRLEVYVVQNRE